LDDRKGNEHVKDPGGRVLVWFSCGDASAVAAKFAIQKYGSRVEVLYCDTFKYESIRTTSDSSRT
jgi:hypothetical protein